MSWYNEINTQRNIEILEFWFHDPKPTDSSDTAAMFWYPLSLLLMLLSSTSRINWLWFELCSCELSLSVYVFSLPYCHILLISAFFVFLFYVLCWLTGPCVACLLSCPSLNVARQSAEPWASKSTKVKLTRLPTTTCPPPSSPKVSPLHCSPTSRHDFPFHGPNEGDWVAESGPHPPTLRLLKMALDVFFCCSIFSSMRHPNKQFSSLSHACRLQHFLSESCVVCLKCLELSD